MTSTPERLLYQLKSRGPQPAATLAAACAITPMGAHKQLQSLAAQGLVQSEDHVEGAGRPKRIWTLSAAVRVGACSFMLDEVSNMVDAMSNPADGRQVVRRPQGLARTR